VNVRGRGECPVTIGVRARGAEGAAVHPTRAKLLFFGQNLIFSGRSQQLAAARNEKKYLFWYLLNEKNGIIHFV